MLILTCSSKLQLLERVLRKGLPETMLVCGAVMHINRGNPAQHEVVVDSWPEFKAVLTRPRKEVVKDNRDYYANLHAAFYREEDACRTLLENKDAVDWDKAFQLQGLQDGLYQAVKVMAEARCVHTEPYFYQALLHPDAATLCQNQLRSEPLHLGTLSPSDAALVNDSWDFAGNDRSLRYLRGLIEDFPNACLRDQEGQLVAWSLSDAIGCLTHGFTLPEYRGKGCMKTVLQALARKLQAKDFALYAAVLPENQNSKNFLFSQGFHLLSLTNYAFLFTPNHLK
ncbi:glycine N-acyltransferase-like protein 3 [Thamnophis elegans]|uniref:glycine N-acyltransferase-like protein 3 n=1 Tax=Thamnophis elegans TaxID=35005 RepID=UPI0013773A8A|nr:glycine N-acyltransferase-like protein 3 [Thamnophis elegans]